MAQEQRQPVGNRRQPTSGIDVAQEWRNCGVYALFLLFMAFIPLSAAGYYMVQQHEPAGTILLSAMFLIFSLVGLWLLTRIRPMLRGGSLGMRVWWAALDLFLCGVAYDSLAHLWRNGPLPTFDQLLPHGYADFMRQAVFPVAMVWLIAGKLIQLMWTVRERQAVPPPPAAG